MIRKAYRWLILNGIHLGWLILYLLILYRLLSGAK
jgi:hypothetical protein